MKVDAKVVFRDKDIVNSLGGREYVIVPVDIDYVSADESEIIEWILNEMNDDDLSKMFGRQFIAEDIRVENMNLILAEIECN